MSRPLFRRVTLVFVLVLLAPGTIRGEPSNVIFFLIDDLGWRDVGFNGSRFYRTPNIDRLAREGMVFTDAYANAPNCAPTRACLMSGLYSPRHGVYTVGSSARGKARDRKLVPTPNRTDLDGRFVTIAEALKAAGYATGTFGKWHLGKDPREQGFDVNAGGTTAGHPKRYFSPYRLSTLSDGPEGEYLTDRLTDEALAFLDANRERPFFLYFPHFAVHTPIQAKKDVTAKYQKAKPDGEQKNAAYAAMVESVDDSVGRVLDKLDALGLAGKTAVFFFSDNGGHGRITSMHPLRGSKGMLHEGGVRVPMAVRWPGRVEPGSRCATPVISVDFYPTILEMAETKRPAATGIGDVPLDGVSLVPLLRGQEEDFAKRSIYWHFPAYLQAYGPGTFRTTPAGAVRRGDHKLIEFFEDGRLELYNVREDIGETKNLAESSPEKAKELLADLRAWRARVKAPVPAEKNPKYRPRSTSGK